MKQTTFLKTMLLAVVLLVGNGMVWGQTTVTYDFSLGTAVTGLNEASPGIALDANIGFGSFKNGSGTVPSIYSGQLRLYQDATKGGSIKIYASNGVTITQVIVRVSGTTGPAAYTVDGGTATDLSTGTTYTMSSLTATDVVEFYQKDSDKKNRIYVDKLEVTYTSGVTCTSLDAPSVTATPGNGQAQLSWDDVPNASSYTLIWNGGSAETVTSPVTKTSLINGTSYSYSLMAVGDGTTYCETNTAATGNVTPVAPAYTITESSNNVAWGTVSRVGLVITGVPAAGYTYASPAYTVTSGTATVSQNVNDFTVTPTSNCAVRINFEAKPTYTLSLNNVGEAYTDSNFPFITYQGNTITLPTLDNCGSYTFVGWDTNSSTTSAPTFAAGATYNTTAGNVTLYAVYSQTTGGGTVTSNLSASIVSTLETMAYATTYTKVIDGKTWTFTGCYRQNASADNLQMNSTDTRYIQTPDMGSEITSVKINVKRNAAGNIGIYTTTGTLIKSIAVTTSANDYIETISGYNQVQIYNSEKGVTNFYSVEVTADASTTTYTTAPNCNAAQITISETELTGFGYVENDGPSAEQSFTVSGVNLTNDISIAATTNYEISKTSGSGYTTPLTFTHSGGTVTEQTVYVRLKSGLTQGTYNDEVINITSTGATTKTVTASGSVTAAPIAEPSNHATGFTATTNSTTEITVTWTDASGGADSYLVKGSSVSAESITAPVDGTAEADAALVKNIASGVQSATFTGLTASTTYYFNIYPYNGTSTSINYKVDGSVPTSSEATATPLAAATATAATAVSTTGFTANWAAVSGATSYDVNVYTKEGGSDGVAVSQGFDAGTTAPTNWIFTGIGGTYTTNTNFGTTSPSLKFDADDDAVLTPTLPSSATELSFWMKGQGAADGSILLVEGYNGSAWVTIQSIVNPIGTGTTYLYTTTSSPALPSNLTQFRFTYTKESGNISFDDVTYKYGSVAENTPITNSPFNVTSATTKELTGLSSGTAYYYTVVAKDATSSSDASNEITVLTAIDGTLDASTLPDCPTCDLVVNNGGVVTLNAGKSYNSVSVKPGAKLTLNNGHAFAPGIFVLESDATATATFVDKRSNANKTNITATVKRHLPAATDRTWWYLASPVTGAASSVFGSNKVGDYSEANRSYSSPFAAPTTLTAGKGYVVKMTAASAANYVFENKTLNTGNISVPLTRTVTETPDNAKRGFNLVGNPYPSYLNWDLAYNNSTNVRSTIWYRTLNGASMEFHTYNATLNASVPSSASGYIPPMQAFWVKVDKDPTEGSVSNGTLNFTNDMRSHDLSALGNPLKAPAADRQLVRLSISNGTLSDETVIVTHPSASDNYDSYDSEKMANGDTNRPEIFSMAGNQELVINGISPLTDSKQIALGVRPGRAGNYTIALTEWRNTGNLEAVLRDNQLGEELILTESNNYSFDTDGSTSTSRFSLLFRAKGSNTGFDHISSDLMIYASQNTIRVESASLEGNTISIFNALGQPIFSGKAQSNRLEINGLTPAVYMVKVNNQRKMVIVK